MDGDLKIAIDVATLDRSTENASRAYTNFGVAVRSVAAAVERDITHLLDEAADVSLPLKPLMQTASTLYPEADYISMENYLRQWERQDRAISDTFEKLGSIKLGSDIRVPRSEFEPPPVDIPVVEVTFAANKADQALRKAEDSFDETEEAEDKSIKRISMWRRFVEREVRSAKGAIKDLISQIPGGIVGGFVSGLIGTIILGYQERNRRRAEMGEMSNVFAAGLDSIFSTETRKAVRWMGNWAERAQWHYGIARQEVQKTVAEMIDNGFKSADLIETYDRGLKSAGRNVVVASIALDRHFNFATGTSMEEIVSFVREYGMELRGATDFFFKMSMAGQRSGMGTMNFIRAVKSSQDSLSRFGINAENVAVLMEDVIGFYESMGLNQRYAGQQAVGVVQDLMSAFSNLDSGMKVVLARRMYNDEETDAYSLLIQFQDGLRRIAGGEEDQYLENLIRSYIEVMRETGLGGRSRMIRTIQQNLGVRNRTAALLYDAGDLIAKGGKLKDLTKEERSNLKRAFKVEASQVSSLHRTRRELVRGMAMLGEALTAIVADIFGILVIGVRSLPALHWAWQNRQLDRVVGNIVAEQRQRIAEISDHWKKGEEGINLVSKALGSEFAETIQPLIDAISGPVKVPKRAAPWTAAVTELEEAWARREEYRQLGERFNKLYLDKEIEETTFGSMLHDTPLWEAPLVGVKLPYQDEFTGAMLQATSDADIGGQTEWAKKNPGKVAEMRRKVNQGWELDPVTGIMENPQTGERWSPSEGTLRRAADRDYGALPIEVGKPKIPRSTDAVNKADKAAAENIF